MTASITRRLFLGRVGASAAVTTAFAGPAVAKAASRPENPELLAWGEKLDALGVARRAAKSGKIEALAEYERLCPRPAELVLTYQDEMLGFYGTEERDWNNDRVRDANGRPRYVITLADVDEAIAEFRPRTKRGKHARNKLHIAQAYEMTKETAEAASGIWNAHAALDDAECTLVRAIEALMKIDPLTLAGVAVKAKAMLVYASTVPEAQGMTWVAIKYGNRVAADLVAVSGGTFQRGAVS